jgi:starch synthase (maltosyl-transferring)
MPIDDRKQPRRSRPARDRANAPADLPSRPDHAWDVGTDDASAFDPSMPLTPSQALRVVIEHVRPQVENGRFPAKRTVDESITVLADIFADGHDVIVAVLRDRPGLSGFDADERPWRETPMTLVAPGTDEWTATFLPSALGWHEYTITAWVDAFATWRRGLTLKFGAGQDVTLELLEGAALVREAAARASEVGQTTPDAVRLEAVAAMLGGSASMDARVAAALDAELAHDMFVYANRTHATHHRAVRVWVDRVRARVGAWYEMFPRSAGPDASRSATFGEAATRLSAIAALGFDVVYLPPIHPIGRSFRKGPNNTLRAQAGDPGSPWAIGSDAGGHTAIEPSLGTLDDFDRFNQQAGQLGLELALDLAWQCSPDHPWVTEHPEWFKHRPDGSIQYAENPPKKYQDIYPLDFTCDAWRSLWQALLDVTRFWLRRGVRIFRVDNPHTKSFGFWEWLIAQVHLEDPGVIFLAEAFTRPKLMRYLAGAGFTQSYTYFTWRNTKEELEAYLTELTATEVYEYLRPNFFANTPDILHEYLQKGGRPAFEARLVLAATLSSTYGIYSGFELCENHAAGPTSEEYLDSEKYQIRHRDWNRPGNIIALVTAINRIRRAHPALQWNGSLRFCETDNPNLIAYTKVSRDGADVVLTIVNLDPHYMQHGHVTVPLHLIGCTAEESFTARDLLSDTLFAWQGARNYVRLDPGIRQAHVLELARPTAADAEAQT